MEYSRLRYQFDFAHEETGRFADSLRSQMAWKDKMRSQGYQVAPFPALRDWITDQCWRDRMPEI